MPVDGGPNPRHPVGAPELRRGSGVRGVPVNRDRGQSTVEFTLVLPLVLILLLGLLQAGLVLRDQLLLSAAAREAAREAAVSPDMERIRSAARRSAPNLNLTVDVSRGNRRGDPVRVIISARPTSVPVVGRIVDRHTLKAAATMRVERADR